MKFDASTPVNEITIGGVSALRVPHPYKGGHVCQDNEAHVLNQVIDENVRNNKRDEIKEMAEKGASLAEMQAVIDQYMVDYEFGTRTGGFRVTDPVEAHMLDSARKKVKAALVKKG